MRPRTYATGIIGILIIVLSIIRWWIIYYDVSQFLFGAGIGFCILFFSYVFYWMDRISKEVSDFKEKVEQISKWWIEQEWKTEHQ